MFYNMDGVSYTRWEEYESVLDASCSVYARFSKQKNKYVRVKNPTKTTIQLVKTTDVGKHTSVITDTLCKKRRHLSYVNDIQPIQTWIDFQFSETNPNILQHLIDGSVIEDNNQDLQIPVIWCWKHFFHDVFHPFTLMEVNDEICVSLEEWVNQTPELKAEFGDDPMELFEHDKGPGVCDVEIDGDDIHVKVLYVYKQKTRICQPQ